MWRFSLSGRLMGLCTGSPGMINGLDFPLYTRHTPRCHAIPFQPHTPSCRVWLHYTHDSGSSSQDTVRAAFALVRRPLILFPCSVLFFTRPYPGPCWPGILASLFATSTFQVHDTRRPWSQRIRTEHDPGKRGSSVALAPPRFFVDDRRQGRDCGDL